MTGYVYGIHPVAWSSHAEPIRIREANYRMMSGKTL